MKINIVYPFKEGAYGGANQFLKALKVILQRYGCYEEQVEKADVVLYNSSNAIIEVLEAKKRNPKALFVQRMDGPTSAYTGQKDYRDLIAFRMNKYVADATIFQSEYSKKANAEMGIFRNQYETVIKNAPNENIFYPVREKKDLKERKIRLIASSWSANWNKGFDVYQFLDSNLDFTKYEMIFVGNAPIKFQNILLYSAMDPKELAETLRSCDIYITASRKDPCSNSLIEAMFCGLPSIAVRDGGHPELVGNAGELFDDYHEIPKLIEKIVNNYNSYVMNMKLKNLDEIGLEYYRFIEEILEKNYFVVKKLTFWKIFLVRALLFRIKIADKCRAIKRRWRNKK